MKKRLFVLIVGILGLLVLPLLAESGKNPVRVIIKDVKVDAIEIQLPVDPVLRIQPQQPVTALLPVQP